MPKEIDNVLFNIVTRSTKRMYINHAKNRGAKKKFLKELEALDWRVVCHTVTILYGEPLTGNELKFNDRKLIR